MERIENQIHHLFLKKGWTLSLAESCTGGSVSTLLVKIPNCSFYFLGSVVAYSNFSKEKLLKVKKETLKKEGFSSEKVALEMAYGALALFHSDFALSITGEAGPRGENVGWVYFAIASKEMSPVTWGKKFIGPRKTIIKKSTEHALKGLFKFLKPL